MDLTLKDAAKLFKVPEHTIQQWIEDNGLPAYRIKTNSGLTVKTHSNGRRSKG